MFGCSAFYLFIFVCVCVCVSGTFVMVFCAARTQPGTNRGDPPLSAINRWISVKAAGSGLASNYPHFRKRKGGKKRARFSPAAAQSGTEGERRASARERRLFSVGACVCWRRADAPRQKRSPERLCASASSCLRGCWGLSVLWNKRAHSCLFFILFLLIAPALTSARLKLEQRWHICGVKESRSNETVLFFSTPLLSLFWQRYLTVRLRGQTESKWLI